MNFDAERSEGEVEMVEKKDVKAKI